MKVVPLITMKDRKMLDTKEELEQLNEEQILYIFDIDGIETDKPNLCTFQRLSKTHEIWADSGPRNLGDIVDGFMAGANAITIRRRLFPKIDISKIREISENKIFADIDLELEADNFVYNTFDGIINFTNRKKLEQDFRHVDLLKQHTNENNVVFTYDSEKENINYWKHFGIDNFLVDLDKFEDFKNAV